MPIARESSRDEPGHIPGLLCQGEESETNASPRTILFRLVLEGAAYVEVQAAEWFILSARYGLVHPNRIIEPYNTTLHEMPSTERRAWAKHVATQLHPLCSPGQEIVLLAGRRYREYLLPVLCDWGCRVRTPMEGLAIGEQKAWLKQELRRLA